VKDKFKERLRVDNIMRTNGSFIMIFISLRIFSASLLNPAPGSHVGTCLTFITKYVRNEHRELTVYEYVRDGTKSTMAPPAAPIVISLDKVVSAIFTYGSSTDVTVCPYVSFIIVAEANLKKVAKLNSSGREFMGCT
jgi:hypothetical protein